MYILVDYYKVNTPKKPDLKHRTLSTHEKTHLCLFSNAAPFFLPKGTITDF